MRKCNVCLGWGYKNGPYCRIIAKPVGGVFRITDCPDEKNMFALCKGSTTRVI